jgi:TonB family protein
MTHLHSLAGHWAVHSLGWTLLHFCWQGTVLALLLWCVLRLMQGSSANARYAATCIALALLVLAPLATFANLALADYRFAHSGFVPDSATLLLDATDGAGPAWSAARLAAALDPLVPGLLLLWMAGATLFTVRLGAGFHVARSLRSTAVSACPADLERRFRNLKSRIGVSKPVALLASSLVQVPTVIGWLRPVVLIPLGCFTGLGELQIDAILSHELAHIRRHDYLVSVVQSVVEAVLFYHPAVWWISMQLRRERECCCDDLAVTIGGNALDYARALSTLELSRTTYPQAVLGANGGVLTMRIKRLLYRQESSAASQAAALVMLAGFTVLAVALANTAKAEAVLTPAARPIATLAAAAPAPLATAAKSKTVARRAPVDKPAVATLAPPVIVPAAPVAAPAPQPAEQSGPARVAGGVMAGQILSKVLPVYPPVAKAAGVTGAVILHAIISAEGDVVNLQIVSGPEMLRMSAIESVRQWKYKPYLLNGQPTEVDTTITVTYSMGEAPAAPLAGVTPPKLIFAGEPSYSEEARAKKISGTVIVHMLVDEQGAPTQVEVVRSLGHGLDEKALEAVLTYRFTPGMENGKAVPYPINTEVNFKIF